MLDRHMKGRTASGENAGAAKLTSEQVAHIRTVAAAATHTQREMAAMSGVSQCAISGILSFKRYRQT